MAGLMSVCVASGGDSGKTHRRGGLLTGYAFGDRP